MVTRVSVSRKQQKEINKRAAKERKNPQSYADEVRSKALHKASRDEEIETHNGKSFTHPLVEQSAKIYSRKTKHKGRNDYD